MPGAGGMTDKGGLENQMVKREPVSNTGGTEAHGAPGTGELIASMEQDVSNVYLGGIL
jgi:hypothetical protein